MKRIKMDKASYMDACRRWRLGVITAEKVIGGDVTLSDFNDYFGTMEWEGPKGYCTTDFRGNVLILELEV